jgi:hypothetical protein
MGESLVDSGHVHGVVTQAVAALREVADRDWQVPADGLEWSWPTLLWATGRAELPRHPRRTEWRWHAE